MQFAPRLIVNSVRAAIASAAEGHGVTRLFSYHVGEEVQAGRLKIVLGDAEPAPLPVHIITPEGRLSVPKVRAFVDFAAAAAEGPVRPPHARACLTGIPFCATVSPG